MYGPQFFSGQFSQKLKKKLEKFISSFIFQAILFKFSENDPFITTKNIM